METPNYQHHSMDELLDEHARFMHLAGVVRTVILHRAKMLSMLQTTEQSEITFPSSDFNELYKQIPKGKKTSAGIMAKALQVTVGILKDNGGFAIKMGILFGRVKEAGVDIRRRTFDHALNKATNDGHLVKPSRGTIALPKEVYAERPSLAPIAQRPRATGS